MIGDEKKVTNIFNDVFPNTVPNLGINTEHNLLNTTNISHNPIENAVLNIRIILVSLQLKNI